MTEPNRYSNIDDLDKTVVIPIFFKPEAPAT
jgi:hypothetical protein